jgi:hypothetical protein
MSLEQDRENRLDRLFAEYRDACPELDGGAEFMPGVWRRIESRRGRLLTWATMSRRVLAASVALCLLFGVAQVTMQSPLAGTYVQVLDDNDETDDIATLHPASYSMDVERE